MAIKTTSLGYVASKLGFSFSVNPTGSNNQYKLVVTPEVRFKLKSGTSAVALTTHNPSTGCVPELMNQLSGRSLTCGDKTLDLTDTLVTTF